MCIVLYAFFFSMSVHIIVNIEGCNILCGDYGIFIAPSSKFLKTNLSRCKSTYEKADCLLECVQFSQLITAN